MNKLIKSCRGAQSETDIFEQNKLSAQDTPSQYCLNIVVNSLRAKHDYYRCYPFNRQIIQFEFSPT